MEHLNNPDFKPVEFDGFSGFVSDLDVPLKMERLKHWCVDINKAQSEIKYDYVFVDEESFDKFKPKSFDELIRNFTKYRAGMVAASSSLIK